MDLEFFMPLIKKALPGQIDKLKVIISDWIKKEQTQRPGKNIFAVLFPRKDGKVYIQIVCTDADGISVSEENEAKIMSANMELIGDPYEATEFILNAISKK